LLRKNGFLKGWEMCRGDERKLEIWEGCVEAGQAKGKGSEKMITLCRATSISDAEKMLYILHCASLQ
jgi:hypothetical protein